MATTALNSTTTSLPDDVSGSMGVTSNSAEDYAAFISALSLNGLTCLGFFAAFSALRLCFPRVYYSNALNDIAPEASRTLFGWIKNGCVRTEVASQSVGLDSALMLEFFSLIQRIMVALCIPLLGILSPLHLYFGGGAAGEDKLSSIGMGNVVIRHPWLYYVHAGMVWYVCIVTTRLIHRAQARFLKFRFEWLLHLPKPRATTILVENIPTEYRSDKCLNDFFSAVFSPDEVEEARIVRKSGQLPRLYKKRAALRQKLRQAELQKEAEKCVVFRGAEGMNAPFVNGTFLPRGEHNGRKLYRKWGSSSVWLVYIKDHWQITNTRLKDLSRNGGWCASMEPHLRSPVDAGTWKKFNGSEEGWEEQESISASLEPPSGACSCLRPRGTDTQEIAQQIEKITDEMREERARLAEEAVEIGGVNSQSGFVRFRSRNYAEMALNLRYSSNKHEWVVSVPPDASDVIWPDLVRGPTAQVLLGIVGYAILAFIFFGFMFIVGIITAGATSIRGLGPLQPVWDGLAPTIGLQVMLALLPTLFVIMFRIFFTLKADAWSQHLLQSWYFWFQVVYVILVAAIGASLLQSLTDIAQKPLSIFSIAAEKLPGQSHFYMNFVVLQWAANAKNMLRIPNLGQYLFYRNVLWEEEAKAHELADPEVQDMGARSATFTIISLIGIIFSTISPLIAFLVLINAMLCRNVYGNLLVYAEPIKADLGGAFWVTQLKHLHIGCMIFCVLMTGMLADRAPSAPDRLLEYIWCPPLPLVIAAPSILYMLRSYSTFSTKFDWQTVPFNELIVPQVPSERRVERKPYIQPELIEDEDVEPEALDAEQGSDDMELRQEAPTLPPHQRLLAFFGLSSLWCTASGSQDEHEFTLLPGHEPRGIDEDSS